MAKVCVMCGKKLGFMQDTMWLSQNNNDEVICMECHSILHDLRYSKDVQSIEQAKKAMIPFFSSNEVSQNVKDILRRDVENAYERIKKIREEIHKTQELEVVHEENRKFVETGLITTGFNFEGYEIVKYCGLVSGEIVLGTGFLSEFSASVSDFFGSFSNKFANKMGEAKLAATSQLIANAVAKGGNAVIGVDFDYITFGNNMIGVSANGTAVVVKKIEE